ncbi:MAG TPA: Hsp20/alpha crystallin family protein [Acidimicrobiales bacterium]|nr:Hsp20/alpha crystallin family protein [Acidimicrobiales bacterium]
MALPSRRDESEASLWEPFAELNRLNQHLARYLERWTDLPSLRSGFTPLADLEETDDAYLVEIELPGVKRDDISVEVAGRRLTVSGERKERERVGILRRRTRTVGRFHYEVVLPGDVEEEGVAASMDEGVLTVRVPKAASERPRRIPVS